MDLKDKIIQNGSHYMWSCEKNGCFLYGFTDSREEAEKALEEADIPASITVDDCFRQFMNGKTDLKPLAIKKYSQLYASFIQPSIGAMVLEEVSPVHLQALLLFLVHSSTSPISVNGVVFILNAVFNYAKKCHFTASNPMEDVEIPHSRKVPSHRSSFTEDELQELLRRVERSDFSLIFQLASWTGMRSGELLGLQWEDVDFNRRVIHVRHTLEYLDKHYVLTTPKTETSIRTIPVSEAHLEELRHHMDSAVYQKRKQLASPINKGFENYVFLSRTGKPFKGGLLVSVHEERGPQDESGRSSGE